MSPAYPTGSKGSSRKLAHLSSTLFPIMPPFSHTYGAKCIAISSQDIKGRLGSKSLLQIYLIAHNTLFTLALPITLVQRELAKHTSFSNNVLFTQALYFLFCLEGTSQCHISSFQKWHSTCLGFQLHKGEWGTRRETN